MLRNYPMIVNDAHYCLFDPDIEERNREFLHGIDSGYFTFLAIHHGEVLESDDRQRVATATRIAYLHALETFFTLLGALIQAPGAAYAWVALCTNARLRELVSKISAGQKIPGCRIEPWDGTWLGLARAVFSGT